MTYSPRPYQTEAIEATLSGFHRGTREMMLHLPTGAGKTVIATLVIERLLQIPTVNKILFLAHRKEIIDQSAEKIVHHLGGDIVSIEQGERVSGKTRVVVASVQSIMKRLDRFSPGEFSVIICDECHHIYAQTWTDTVRYFKKGCDTTLIGMSATPKRTDGRESEEIFGETVFSISLDRLQDLGYLVPIEYFTTEAQLNLEAVGMSQGDFRGSGLARVMNSPELIEITLRAWLEKGAGKKTIAFCSSVSHAKSLTEGFRAMGLNCETITGQTRDRDRILADFRAGAINMITNFGVLTEGFDDPSIECVLLARPTTSPLVYNQCLGRGLRTHPGKKSCVVIDIIDRSTHQLQYNVFEATGLKRTWKSKSHGPMREAAAMSRIKVGDPCAFVKLKNANSLEETHSILMSLPAESVLAGIDGDRLIRYEGTDTKLEDVEAISRSESILSQFEIKPEEITLVEGKLRIAINPAAKDKLRPFLLWHIRNATGWEADVKVQDWVRVSVKEAEKLKALNPKTQITKLSQKKKISALRIKVEPHSGGFLATASMELDGSFIETPQFHCVANKGAEQAACENLLKSYETKYPLPSPQKPKKGKKKQPLGSRETLHTLLQKGVILDLGYDLLGETGPDHAKLFSYEAWLEMTNKEVIRSGATSGRSKREAQKKAAETLYARYQARSLFAPPKRERKRKTPGSEPYFPMADMLSSGS